MLDNDIVGLDAKFVVLTRDQKGNQVIEHCPCHVEYEIELNPSNQQKLFKVRMEDGTMSSAWRNQLILS